MEEIQRMQDNLLLIRRTVGWTAEAFGDQIGVTRQTINNIESGRNKLTKTQYIAMRSVIEAEMVKHPDETQMLRALLDMLIDHPENYSKEDYESLLEKANMMSPSILAGTSTRENYLIYCSSVVSVKRSRQLQRLCKECILKAMTLFISARCLFL